MKKKNKTPVTPIQSREHQGFVKARLAEVREVAHENVSLGICIALTAGFALVVSFLANEAGAAHGLFSFTATVLVGAIVVMLLTQKSWSCGKELVAAYRKILEVLDPVERAKMDVEIPTTGAFLRFGFGALVALACLAGSAWLAGLVMGEVQTQLGGSVMYSLLDFLHRNLMGLGLALFLISRVDFLADWLVALNKSGLAEMKESS